jgi:hypothetical protein
MNKCTCGGDKCGTPHSNWCDSLKKPKITTEYWGNGWYRGVKIQGKYVTSWLQKGKELDYTKKVYFYMIEELKTICQK